MDERIRFCGGLNVNEDKFRDGCLSVEWLRSRREAVAVIETWRQHYNEVRPHSSLDYRTPAELKQHNQLPQLTRSITESMNIHPSPYKEQLLVNLANRMPAKLQECAWFDDGTTLQQLYALLALIGEGKSRSTIKPNIAATRVLDLPLQHVIGINSTPSRGSKESDGNIGSDGITWWGALQHTHCDQWDSEADAYFDSPRISEASFPAYSGNPPPSPMLAYSYAGAVVVHGCHRAVVAVARNLSKHGDDARLGGVTTHLFDMQSHVIDRMVQLRESAAAGDVLEFRLEPAGPARDAGALVRLRGLPNRQLRLQPRDDGQIAVVEPPGILERLRGFLQAPFADRRASGDVWHRIPDEVLNAWKQRGTWLPKSAVSPLGETCPGNPACLPVSENA